MLKQLYWRLLRPLAARVLHDDPWVRYPTRLGRDAFGEGHRTPRYLLSNASTVVCHSVADVCVWLAGCDKVASTDGPRPVSFHTLDGFELARRGNCRAHAQWAFAQLARLGYDPSLIVGRRVLPSGRAGTHVWVQFWSDGEEYLLDGMEAAPDVMLQLLAVKKHEYMPYYGASASGAEFVFPAYVRREMDHDHDA